MSNLGLEQALKARGIEFLRAAVGDRYVLELLKQHGGVLGGETSGTCYAWIEPPRATAS